MVDDSDTPIQSLVSDYMILPSEVACADNVQHYAVCCVAQ